MIVALWTVGIWFAVLCVLSFIFGMTGILFDDDWGIFIVVLTIIWPLVLLVVLLVVFGAIPFALLYLFVRTIGMVGIWFRHLKD